MGSLNHLFAQTTCTQARKLLEHWAWLTAERSVRPVALTIFGDWFLEDRHDGRILFLDAGAGSLEEVARSREEWREACRNPQNQQNWFLAGQYELLRRGGRPKPRRGECYSWVIPPAAGGSLEVDNLELERLATHQEVMARATERLSELPPGTRITPELLDGFVEDDDERSGISAIGLLAGVAVALFTFGRLLF